MAAQPKKIIIDTDPGIDDAMAIFLALRSPEVELIGLTTVFGNVYTTLATRNALHLLEVAGRTDIPVAEGSHVTINKDTKPRVADFVHGADGLGNQNFPPPKGKAIEQSAAAFLIEQANLYPGKVTVVALGALTNIALAIQQDPAFSKNIGQIILLGGAFAINGNVNPAAEANIFGDPDAADIVFTSGADVLAVGLNVTHQVILTAKVPSKVAFFGWLVSLEKVLTTDNLRKRGFYVMDWCTMCKNDGESVNHLFLHCEMATALWNELFVKLGIVWVMPFQVVDFLVCWQGAAGSRRNIEEWRMIPLCLFWCLWLERNGRCFEDRERTRMELRDFFFNTLNFWANNLLRDINFCNVFL
ncbi:probable uridine nucleosidase 2 isoform X1 [Carya illinoinensis]|uniref:probable uridine nucleosidase 2 isoform X1 n=1 Tax=Carya illinoinensis TaxID=32201 RepID=UPI001C718D25|nr:probable uridine nucleosidase 2 isoform X1 [Carya illinoinensis]